MSHFMWVLLYILLVWIGIVAGDGVSVETIQLRSLVVDTRTITFLSSGYKSKAQFLTDVKTSVAALYNNSGAVLSDPWPRYISLFNIYAVFEPSAEEGVSVPQNMRCNFMERCPTPIVKDNNLNCSLGSPNPHVLDCNLERVVKLASRAPVRDIVVVIVNEDAVSGVATSGIAYITNKENYMPFLLVHYLNRATANLHEEYDFGFSEPQITEYVFPNCVANAEEAIREWGFWGVTANTLGNTCSFNNYFAPTQNACLMRNLTVGQMCPICREQLVLSFFNNGVQNGTVPGGSTSSLNVLSGRCPPESVIIYVNRTEGIYLSVGPFAYQNDIQTTWYTNDGSVISNSSTEINITNMESWTFPTVIRVSSVDHSPFVRPEKRTPSFGSTSLFIIQERTADTDCIEATSLPCMMETLGDHPVTSMCFSIIDGASQPLSSGDVSDLTLEEAKPAYEARNVIIAGCIAGGVCVLYLLLLIVLYFTVVSKRPREILLLSLREKVMFILLLAWTIADLMFAIVTVCIIIVYIPRQFIFGWQLFVAGLVLSIIIIFLQIFNVTGVLCRWWEFCGACSCFQLILAVGEFAVGVYTLWAHSNKDSSHLGNTIANIWESASDIAVCSMQERLRCSGFNVGCFMTDFSACPDDCSSNTNVNGCRVPVMLFMSEQYRIIAIIQICMGILLLVTSVFNSLYFLFVKKLSAKGKLRRSFRNMADPPLPPITKSEVDAVRNLYRYECKRFHVDGLEGKQLIKFVEAVFAEPVAVEFIDVLAASGQVSFDELMCTYFPFVKESQDPETLKRRRTSEVFLSWEALLSQHHSGGDILDIIRESVGTLSPDRIHLIIQKYVYTNPLPPLSVVTKEFTEAADSSPDAYLREVLSPIELEALRGAWVALNPKLNGDLSGPQLEHFYYWTHDNFPNRSEFQEWKKKISVVNKISTTGWGEFCYVFAKKKLLEESVTFVKARNMPVPSGLVSKSAVVHRYGYDTVSSCFLPYESEIPKVRLLRFVLENDIAGGNDLDLLK
ncbi:IgA Peptidase M64, putative [Angomonas deanei]|uniref:IgA Peptidase M64, putative n=1 Tax=Angomonas deanei TaxID=59799 RepID=A0A7G2C798_9TRYP|nr:IgA Peptidase M64, putative [Angomonas deanei]